MSVEIYTDGSCHTQKCIGAWAAIIINDGEKIVLAGTEVNTTHNRMELTAVIRALETVKNNSSTTVVSDSQYVVRLTERKKKLLKQFFTTKTGKEIRNADLVKAFFKLDVGVRFVKIKAHQKKSDAINYNIEVDILTRKLMREGVS